MFIVLLIKDRSCLTTNIEIIIIIIVRLFLAGNLPENHSGKTRSLRRQKSGLRAKADIFS